MPARQLRPGSTRLMAPVRRSRSPRTSHLRPISGAWSTRRIGPSAASTSWSATRQRIRITGQWAVSRMIRFRKIFENNVLSNHWLIQMVAPKMIERKDGAIVIVSSIGGLKGSTVLGAYCVSKAADFQLARNLAAEWGKHNVRVNCIAPGLIKTDFARALWENPDTLKEVTSTSPMRRIGLPDEIAGAAVFLASPAGSFVTGQAIVIDGGATIAGE